MNKSSFLYLYLLEIIEKKNMIEIIGLSNSQSNNSNKNQWIKVLLYFILFIVILFIIYYIVTMILKTNQEKSELKKYDIVTMPKHGSGKNFIKCPVGCERGVCINKHKPKHENKAKHEIKAKHEACQYDFECQYCEDTKTQQFYVGGNYENEIKIIPTYEQPKINKDDLTSLNKDIVENNIYIHKLNEKIRYENGVI